MKKVIVTGANGFIGSNLIGALISRGIKVTAVDCRFAPCHLPDSGLIEKIESNVDLSLKNKIPADDYDVLYNLAWRGVNGSDKANPYIQLDNIRMALDCATISKKLNIKKFFCAGTVAENSVSSLPDLSATTGGMMYGSAKKACRIMVETYCKNIGQTFVWMQFSNIYGVGNKTGNLVSYTLEQLMSGKDATFGPASQPYDFIYVNDLIDALCRMGSVNLSKSFYFIGSGKPRILKDYLYSIGDILDKRIHIKIGERPDDGIKYTLEMFDNGDLTKEVGDYVGTSFKEGIERTVEWLKEENNDNRI